MAAPNPAYYGFPADQPSGEPLGVSRESEPAPLGSEAEFAAILDGLVASEKPRLFALCEEYGERADGWILAWGMAFEDRTEVVGVDGLYASVRSPEVALRLLAPGLPVPRRRLRLVWCDGTPFETGG